MPSTISWVQFDDKDMKDVRQFLSDLSQGTVDELGFGKIRTYFADLFFPAMTTIMTRPRYLIYLPALLEEASRNKDSRKKLTDLEDRLGKDLSQTDPFGVIGRVAGVQIAKHPSEIYWNALKELGIVKYEGGITTYLQALKKVHHAEVNEEGQKESLGLASYLDAGTLVLSKKALLKKNPKTNEKLVGLDMRKERQERAHLIELYKNRSKDSLLSFLFDHPKQRHKEFHQLNLPARHVLRQAHRDSIGFSMTGWGASLVYRTLIARKANATTLIAGCEKAIKEWRASKEFKIFVEDWFIDEALRAIENSKHWVLRTGPGVMNDRAFFKSLHSSFVLNSDTSTLIGNISNIIEQREWMMKRDRAKLAKSELLISEDELSPPPGQLLLMEYRWSVAKRFLNDLVGDDDNV